MNPGIYAVTFAFHLYDMIWYSNKEKQREIIILIIYMTLQR